jgi:hypothetical protein
MTSTTRPAAKGAALRAAGALHPRPELVTDPLFAAHPFFDPRDLIQVKYELLRRVRVEEQTVSHAVAAFGLSRPAFYRARAAFARAGLPGLLPQRRGSRSPRKLRAEVHAFLAQVWSAEPALRPRDLAERVHERFGLRLHRRTIARHLGRLPAERAPPRPARRSRRPPGTRPCAPGSGARKAAAGRLMAWRSSIASGSRPGWPPTRPNHPGARAPRRPPGCRTGSRPRCRARSWPSSWPAWCGGACGRTPDDPDY